MTVVQVSDVFLRRLDPRCYVRTARMNALVQRNEILV